MMGRHLAGSASTIMDQRGGVAATGCTHRQGHSALIATAWIETLHSRAERSAERHNRAPRAA